MSNDKVIEAEYVDVEPLSLERLDVHSNTAIANQELLQSILSQPVGRSVDPEVAKKICENKPFNTIDGVVLQQNLDGGHTRSRADFLKALCSSAMTYGLDPLDSSFDEESKKIVKNYPHNSRLDHMFGAYKSAVEICELDQRLNEKSQISVLPNTAMADLLFAAPYVYATGIGLPDQMSPRQKLPTKTPLKEYVGNIFSGINLSDFFQMYNVINRPISAFNSRSDVMTRYITEVIPHAQQVFDAILILTPYHTLAVQEWSKVASFRINRDPYLIGINYDCSDIFLIGRWVGSGVFPNFLSMVQDTIENIEQNGRLTGNIAKHTQWVKGRDNRNGGMLESWNDETNSILPFFCNRLLKAYEENTLFDFLRK